MTIEYVTGDKVITLDPMRRRVRFPALGLVEAYWEGLRDGRLMPTRGDVDPRGIADVLEFAFVLDKIAPGLARIRLAGMHLNELMAMEVRGMPVSALFLPEARRELQRVLESVLDEPAVVRLTLQSDRGYTRPPLDAQMILLPLRDATGRPARILGALQAHGDIGRGPRRFAIRDIETKPLMTDPLTARPLWPMALAPDDGTATGPSAHPPARRHDPDAPAGQTRVPRRAEAPHLTLVYDADNA